MKRKYNYPANLEMKDSFKSKRIIKDRAPNLPCNILVLGKSGSGKSNTAVSMMIRPFDKDDDGGSDFYLHDFKGEDIFILTAKANPDEKLNALIEVKEIPEDNIQTLSADELDEMMQILYENIIEDSMENGKRHRMIFIDDLSYGGGLLKKHQGALNEILCNGRKWLISTMITSQNLVDLPTSARRQCRCMITYALDDRDKELLAQDFREKISKKEFYNLLCNATEGSHNYLVIDKSEGKPFCDRYKDMNFDPFDKEEFANMCSKLPITFKS